MNLFDRYFLVLAGRLNAERCDAVATMTDSGDPAISLGWPLDPPEQSEGGDDAVKTPELTTN